MVILGAATWVSLTSRSITTKCQLTFVMPVPQPLAKAPSTPAHGDGLQLVFHYLPGTLLLLSLSADVKASCTDWPWWPVLTCHPSCPHRNLLVLNAEPSFHQPPKGIVLSSPSLGPQKHPHTDVYQTPGQILPALAHSSRTSRMH